LPTISTSKRSPASTSSIDVNSDGPVATSLSTDTWTSQRPAHLPLLQSPRRVRLASVIP
jgi:hypothetical protein